MRTRKIGKIAVIGVAAITVFGFVVMGLWNWLAPAVFGLHAITYWQALGLLVLSRILFGGLHGRPGPGRRWRERMRARWEKMTPEEREKFLRGMESPFGCRGGFNPPSGESGQA